MSNLFAKLSRLTQEHDLLIGKVLALYDDSSKLEDHNGQTFYAAGASVAVNAWAYVQNGVIVGEAPAIAPVEVLIS